MTLWRSIRLTLVILALAAAFWLGLGEGVSNLSDATTPGQWVATFTQLIYGMTALLCLVALRSRSTWAPPVLGLWALTTTITATLAPVVWGGTGWGTGLVSGLATILIVALVAWGYLAHAGLDARFRPIGGNPDG